ncbi:MAG: MarP family serine protease, partial [Microbacteriaceae bacterium]|nr:MarP family serine protease [Microbacteriaceae bacterium]
AVLRSINSLTPAPIQQAMAQLRSIIVQQGIPRIISAAEGGIEGGNVPGTDTAPSAPPAPSPIPSPDAPPLQKAAASVVRVTGSAYQCGQDQSGSGFVVADGRVITNAHVVAGVDEPVVEIPGVTALPGKVVYFDPQNDLAVIAVPGLQIAPLNLGSNLAVGSAAVFDGYPYGGPFQSSPARVDRVFTVRVNDIYGANPAPLEVYQLAAEVHEGNSGGPLLDSSGRVTGLVFAKSANTSGVGYALTMAELEPVADQAAALSSRVSSGHCVKR